jgi:hypothetical protein
MSRLDVVVENLRIVEVKPAEYPKVLDSPAKCAYHVGLLSMLPANNDIPEECLVCPKLLQCGSKRR